MQMSIKSTYFSNLQFLKLAVCPTDIINNMCRCSNIVLFGVKCKISLVIPGKRNVYRKLFFVFLWPSFWETAWRVSVFMASTHLTHIWQIRCSFRVKGAAAPNFIQTDWLNPSPFILVVIWSLKSVPCYWVRLYYAVFLITRWIQQTCPRTIRSLLLYLTPLHQCCMCSITLLCLPTGCFA